MTSQTGQYVGNQTPEGVINFGLGQPAPALLPRDRIADAARRLADADPLLLQYGTGRGFRDFREALAAFLSRRHGVAVSPDEVACSGAISLSLSLAADAFGRPSGRRGVIACEDPTYFLARGVFASAGCDVVGVPVDADGLDVDALESKLRSGQAIDAVYTIPAFQNPTGATLSDARRARLFELAAEHGFVVLADEPYNLLSFDDAAVPRPLAAHDDGRDHVLSISSFTKILAPGLRLGWVQGSRAVTRRFFGHGVFRSGGALNPIMAFVVEGLLRDGGLDEHLDQVRAMLASRAAALVDALRTELPEVEFEPPRGGYFVWARLPWDVAADDLLERAREHGVAFVPGPRCAVDGPARDRVRLSFSFYDEAEIREGVERLRRALSAARGG